MNSVNYISYICILFLFLNGDNNSKINFVKVYYAKKNYIPNIVTKSENKNYEDQYNNNIEALKEKLKIVTKKLEFVLNINDNESTFELGNLLVLDYKKESINLATSQSGGKGIYYTNIKTKEFLHQNDLGGQQFIIEHHLDSIVWILSNETKFIGKYKCYKATTIKIVKSRKTYHKKVTAWYAPELPYKFGPIGYASLPGLILELNIEKGATFLIKKMILNPNKEINIKKPKKGIKVTEKEFNQIAKKIYLDLTER